MGPHPGQQSHGCLDLTHTHQICIRLCLKCLNSGCSPTVFSATTNGRVQVYELSDLAEDFLRAQFCAYDQDGDGLLSWQQLDAMFSTIPPPMWQVSVCVCVYRAVSWQQLDAMFSTSPPPCKYTFFLYISTTRGTKGTGRLLPHLQCGR